MVPTGHRLERAGPRVGFACASWSGAVVCSTSVNPPQLVVAHIGSGAGRLTHENQGMSHLAHPPLLEVRLMVSIEGGFGRKCFLCVILFRIPEYQAHITCGNGPRYLGFADKKAHKKHLRPCGVVDGRKSAPNSPSPWPNLLVTVSQTACPLALDPLSPHGLERETETWNKPPSLVPQSPQLVAPHIKSSVNPPLCVLEYCVGN